MQERYCTENGKVSHTSENEARQALSSLKRAKGYNGHVYVCAFCGFFHVGRLGKRTVRNKLMKKKERKKHARIARSRITIYITGLTEGLEQVGQPDRESPETTYLQGLHDSGGRESDLPPQIQPV